MDLVSRRSITESKDSRARGSAISLKEVGRVGIPSIAESWLEEKEMLDKMSVKLRGGSEEGL